MVPCKMFILIVVACILLLAAQSCSKQPVACYTTNISIDSIHRNQPVTFDATCSVNAGSYNWQFYNRNDSVAFTPIVTKVFPDSGTVNVYLLVTSGNSFAGLNTNITVLP